MLIPSNFYGDAIRSMILSNNNSVTKGLDENFKPSLIYDYSLKQRKRFPEWMTFENMSLIC